MTINPINLIQIMGLFSVSCTIQQILVIICNVAIDIIVQSVGNFKARHFKLENRFENEPITSACGNVKANSRITPLYKLYPMKSHNILQSIT